MTYSLEMWQNIIILFVILDSRYKHIIENDILRNEWSNKKMSRISIQTVLKIGHFILYLRGHWARSAQNSAFRLRFHIYLQFNLTLGTYRI